MVAGAYQAVKIHFLSSYGIIHRLQKLKTQKNGLEGRFLEVLVINGDDQPPEALQYPPPVEPGGKKEQASSI